MRPPLIVLIFLGVLIAIILVLILHPGRNVGGEG